MTRTSRNLDNAPVARQGALELWAALAALLHFSIGNVNVAKSATIKIKLVSSADTGFYYVTKKNPRNTTEKMTFRKYDPVVRKHVDFKEAKIK